MAFICKEFKKTLDRKCCMTAGLSPKLHAVPVKTPSTYDGKYVYLSP